jgi:hypothetical protein
MNYAESTNKNRRPSFLGRLLRPVSTILIVAILVTALPKRASAKYQDLSGSLPGIVPTGAVVGAAVGAAALIGLLLYYKLHHKSDVKLQVDPDLTKFADVMPGQSAEKVVPVRNNSSHDVKIDSVSIDDTTGVFRLSNLPSLPKTLAPQDSLNIPLTVSANNGGGSAQIRIVASNPSAKSPKDEIRTFKVSYGQAKKKKVLGIIP